MNLQKHSYGARAAVRRFGYFIVTASRQAITID